VLVRRLMLLLAVPVLLVAGCGGSSDNAATSTSAIKLGPTPEIGGPWAGKLTQAGIAPFRIAVVINDDGTGLVAYTGIDCAGHWSLDSGEAPSYVFTEEITEGRGGECKGTGTVHLTHTAPGKLSYRFEGGGVTSSGLLAPASMRALIAIFGQAGVSFTESDTGKPPRPSRTRSGSRRSGRGW
jgi:hypothetical protein